ncbi:hypothetical protein CRYPA_1806 [uncultured Candidatus Thioglobus sp.]|nr:hypothetical protein CRYPA_1806 [uncultured Candidatus Thioglobus sp.]
MVLAYSGGLDTSTRQCLAPKKRLKKSNKLQTMIWLKRPNKFKKGFALE